MTSLLEFKQKIKGIYAQYEMYLLPLLKFVLALIYFIWINTNMGYMTALDNIFVVLILSLLYSSIRNDDLRRICTDGGTLLCTWNRSGSFSSDTDSVHDDPFPAFQQR